VIFLSLQEQINLKTIGRYADGIVGILMVILGISGAYMSVRNYRNTNAKKDSDMIEGMVL
jgi:hypothetical protein